MKLPSLLFALLLCPAAFAATTAAPATPAAPSGVTGSLIGTNFDMSWGEVTAASGYNIRCAVSDAALTTLDASDPAMTSTLPTVNGTPLNPNTVTSYVVPNISGGTSCEVDSWVCTTACAVSAPSAHVIATAGSSSSSGGSSGSGSSSSGSSSSGGSGGSSIPVTLTNGNATLTWAAPTTNTDGSALTNLAGYNVYQGTSATALAKVNSALITPASDTILSLPAGTYFWAVTAVNSSGQESAQTPAVSAVVPQAVQVTITPSAPSGLKLIVQVSGSSP